jgi:hypothetical protein
MSIVLLTSVSLPFFLFLHRLYRHTSRDPGSMRVMGLELVMNRSLAWEASYVFGCGVERPARYTAFATYAVAGWDDIGRTCLKR